MHTPTQAKESQDIKKYSQTHECMHAHSTLSPQWTSKPLSSLHSSISSSGGRKTHEMIPDMTDHRAALVEPSDINTFLPDCGQVRQGDLQWFPLAVAPAVSALLAGVTDASPLSKFRNAGTWKTGNSGFSVLFCKLIYVYVSCTALILKTHAYKNDVWLSLCPFYVHKGENQYNERLLLLYYFNTISSFKNLHDKIMSNAMLLIYMLTFHSHFIFDQWQWRRVLLVPMLTCPGRSMSQTEGRNSLFSDVFVSN